MKRMKKMNKEQKSEMNTKLHKHIAINGAVFGKEHPINAVHSKKSTQEAHDYTISIKS